MKIKKWLTLIILVMAVFASTVAALAVKEAHRIFGGKAGDHVAWELDNRGVLVITGAGEIKPNQYDDYRDHYVNKTIIERGITDIGADAFAGCTMREISIPDTVTIINGSALRGCKNVEELVIPDSVTWIGWYTFQYMSSLKHIQLSKNITQIYPYTFSQCSSLATIVIPEGVTYIGEEAFAWCTNLRAIVLPESLETIDEKAFLYCDKLWHIFYAGTEEQWNEIEIGSKFNDSFLAITPHFNCTGKELQEQVVKEASCIAKGQLQIDCGICGESKVIATGKRPHEYQYACHGLCKNCGSTEGADHSWKEVITKVPTCKEEGIRIISCRYCEESTEEAIEKGQWHTYDNKCDNECNICGHTRDRSHKWDEGVVTKEPTCGEEGITTYTCTECKETKTEGIENSLPHTYDHACDPDCNICGQQRATSHVPGEPATETTDQVCAECGAVLVPATGPAPTEPAQPTQPMASTTPTEPSEPQTTQPATGHNTPTIPGTDPDASGLAIVVIILIGATIGIGVLLIVLRKNDCL